MQGARKKYRAKPGTKVKEAKYRKGYRKRPGVKVRARNNSFKNKSGITRTEADQLALDQGGVCKICGLAPKGKRHHARLHVDHCHATGKIRGMLCHSCNTAIGLFKENPNALRAALEYLTPTATY